MHNDKIIQVNKIHRQWQTLDPFLFCVHHVDFFPEGNDILGPKIGTVGRNIGQDFANKDGWNMYHGQDIPGFPVHPHRGFETITIVEQGIADHADSLGSSGRYGKGDVQWMTAGKGVQHSEMFPLINSETSNTLELFQIWLNLPKENKMAEPDYKMFWAEDIPIVNEKDTQGNTIEIKIIAGIYKDIKAQTPPPESWASKKDSHLAVWLVKLQTGAIWTLSKSEKGLNKAIYMYNGESIDIEGSRIENYRSVQVNSSEDIQIIAGKKDVDILVLQGKPINEPVAQYGPFVMSTEAEIQQAFEDYQATKFGGWPWPNSEPVHPKEQQRFANYPNGETVTPKS